MLQLLKNQTVYKRAEPEKKHKTEIIVFIVDDDRDDRAHTFSMLTGSSYVAEACPVPSAKALFQCFEKIGVYDTDFAEEQEALILLDIHMPDTDGIKTLDFIRNHPMTASIPVVLLSSDVSGDRMLDAYALEVNGFLQKPFNLDDFNKVIESNYSWATI